MLQVAEVRTSTPCHQLKEVGHLLHGFHCPWTLTTCWGGKMGSTLHTWSRLFVCFLRDRPSRVLRHFYQYSISQNSVKCPLLPFQGTIKSSSCCTVASQQGLYSMDVKSTYLPTDNQFHHSYWIKPLTFQDLSVKAVLTLSGTHSILGLLSSSQ